MAPRVPPSAAPATTSDCVMDSYVNPAGGDKGGQGVINDAGGAIAEQGRRKEGGTRVPAREAARNRDAQMKWPFLSGFGPLTMKNQLHQPVYEH